MAEQSKLSTSSDLGVPPAAAEPATTKRGNDHDAAQLIQERIAQGNIDLSDTPLGRHIGSILGTQTAVPGAQAITSTQSGFQEIHFDAAQRQMLMTKAATCPFMRAAIQNGAVSVGNSLEDPTGKIDDVVKLGNAGGGDLGNVLKFFAEINHNRLNGPAGLAGPTPAGSFGLWFPGSAGSHPGHSGILQSNPKDASSGGLSEAKLDNLTSNYATVTKDGKSYIPIDQIGKFIAQNVANDPNSRGLNLAALEDLLRQVRTLMQRVEKGDPNVLKEVAHLIVTPIDVVNSAGEYSLLYTRFGDAQDGEGRDMVSTNTVDSLFRDGQMPAHWADKKATTLEWVKNVLFILESAIPALITDRLKGGALR
jgi:hypothetical protein